MHPIIPLLFLASAVNAQVDDSRSISLLPVDLNGLCSTAPVNQVTFHATFFDPGIYGVLLLPSSQYQILAAGLKNNRTVLPVNYYTQYSCVMTGNNGVTSCSTTLDPATVSTNETTCLACVNSGSTAVTGTISVQFKNESGPIQVPFPTGQPQSTGQPHFMEDFFSMEQHLSAAQPISITAIIGIALGCVVGLAMIGGVTVYFMKRRRLLNLNTDYNKPTLGAMESAPVWPESKADRIPPPTVPFWAESDTDDLDPGIVVAE